VAIERKATREAHSRLQLWSAYLEELNESDAAHADYPQEVRQRVMVSRLLAWGGAGPELDANAERTHSLDSLLRRRFEAGPFLWETLLEQIYRMPDFWFLYGRPSSGAAAYLA
jgi:hypothetical protein